MTRSALRNSQSTSSPTRQQPFPLQRRQAGQGEETDVVLQLSTWTQDPETFQGPQRTWLLRPGLLLSFNMAELWVRTWRSRAETGRSPGQGTGREGKPSWGPASSSILRALGGPPLELAEGIALASIAWDHRPPYRAIFPGTTQIIWGPKEKVS